MTFKVLIENTDEVFGCSEGQHILSAMSKMGKKVFHRGVTAAAAVFAK
jgi:hypothetical protein